MAEEKRRQTKLGFEVYPIDKFNKRCSHWSNPEEIGYFSIDSSKDVRWDKSSLKYLYKKNIGPSVCFDLAVGSESTWDMDHPLDIGDMLRWFCQKFETEGNLDENKPDFVCRRGLLTELMLTPYERYNGWLFAVQKFKDILFMMEVDTQQTIQRKQGANKLVQNSWYWGFKFEQYMTTDKPDGEPVTTALLDTNSKFRTVVKARIGNYSLFVGGEIDCVTSDQNYVELKTTREFRRGDKSEYIFYRYKMLRCWAQSILLGVRNAVWGFRNDAGVVREVELYQISDIPGIARRNVRKSGWNEAICKNFLQEILIFVKETAVENNNIYQFEWSPGSNVQCRSVTDMEVLPSWFTNKYT